MKLLKRERAGIFRTVIQPIANTQTIVNVQAVEKCMAFTILNTGTATLSLFGGELIVLQPGESQEFDGEPGYFRDDVIPVAFGAIGTKAGVVIKTIEITEICEVLVDRLH